MVKLIGDERLDYLVANEQMGIIQSPTVFSYSLDALLLADFAQIPFKNGRILDFCSGNGIIPLVLSQKTESEIIGVEIQERLYDMAKRSIKYNHLTEQIKMIHGDLSEMKQVLKQSYYDTVTCNPPYFVTAHANEKNKNEHLTIARHEVRTNLEEVIKACKLHVKPKGKVALVHRPDRLIDLITSMRAYKIEPKRLRLVYPKQGREANMILIEGIRDGSPGLKVLSPLYIYTEEDEYTQEAREIIYREA